MLGQDHSELLWPFKSPSHECVQGEHDSTYSPVDTDMCGSVSKLIVIQYRTQLFTEAQGQHTCPAPCPSGLAPAQPAALESWSRRQAVPQHARPWV